jgi:hypothetical protein
MHDWLKLKSTRSLSIDFLKYYYPKFYEDYELNEDKFET